MSEVSGLWWSTGISVMFYPRSFPPFQVYVIVGSFESSVLQSWQACILVSLAYRSEATITHARI
jgi:hypothetical protein